ncbi:MAG: 7-cyano-7-deazaguanine synthase, partial [Caldilineaceae bacterium]|nr:7-cyano-7-deazaguanine synthase [Caldilineaceae bacterium]
PEFIAAYQQVINVATKATVQGATIQIATPLQRLSKIDIVRRAFDLAVPLDLTWSCYVNGPESCGVCDSCRLREEALVHVKRERGML